MTKLIYIKFLIILFLGICQKSFSQEFYPTNISSIITDENLLDKQLAKLNKSYLFKKGFEFVNDSISVNKNTLEKITLSTTEKDNLIHLTINYLTFRNSLLNLKKRLQDPELNLTKINENLYEIKYEKYETKIEIIKNLEVKSKPFYLIKTTIIYEKPRDNRYIFPLKTIYPFQNTTWYFDLDYKISKSNSEENIIKIILKKDKSNYKIMFLDDINFIIIFNNVKNISEQINGKYYNNSNIVFSIDYEIRKGQNGMPNVQEINANYLKIIELNKLKNTKKYFEFFFNRTFQIEDDGNKISLETQVYNDEHNPIQYPTIKAQ
ncbi:hypothetical protein [Kaistella antarctica]|uniref:Uncharacterized protein n=1 Tax=Kaistella antarctica TaxID=266748 RepID=A0A3S4W530_9FLAO|nr:hypothetical protein [Kaistella antarctica]KEY17726.1 hypothetical protein HY04_14865 [Kaistella antarctica]SEV80992.1 hypothetical protein SAMN05421765_0201 [Kaistella antarctica]VEI00245.1 Uncharacterised protein [Kaistella antarctica]